MKYPDFKRPIVSHLSASKSSSKSLRNLLVVSFIVLTLSGCSVFGIRTTEEAAYSVLKIEGDFELRQYESFVTVNTTTKGDFDQASRKSFNLLFDYISGDNKGDRKIAMTAPVMASEAPSDYGKKIAMTAPVMAQEQSEGWQFAFVLPREYTLASSPLPANQQVSLAQVPPKKVAVLRYSGLWDQRRYENNIRKLEAWMEDNDLIAASSPSYAGYDPPWTLPFLRRNEVAIKILE